MYSRNKHRDWITRERNQLIDGVCLNPLYQTEEFRDRLFMLVSATVADEYVGAVYYAMLTKDTLTSVSIKFNVSEALLSKLIKEVKKKWDVAFKGWKFANVAELKKGD